jgi:hypothetical protein
LSGPYEHERARLHAIVDAWVDSLNADPVHESDCRIDVATVGGVLRGSDAEGDTVECPSFYAECSSVWQQVGLFSVLADAAASGHPDAAE